MIKWQWLYIVDSRTAESLVICRESELKNSSKTDSTPASSQSDNVRREMEPSLTKIQRYKVESEENLTFLFHAISHHRRFSTVFGIEESFHDDDYEQECFFSKVSKNIFHLLYLQFPTNEFQKENQIPKKREPIPKSQMSSITEVTSKKN